MRKKVTWLTNLLKSKFSQEFIALATLYNRKRKFRTFNNTNKGFQSENQVLCVCQGYKQLKILYTVQIDIPVVLYIRH